MWKIHKLFSLSSQDCSRQWFIDFYLVGVFAFIVWKISLEFHFQFIHKHTEIKLDIQLATLYSGNTPTNNSAGSVNELDISVNMAYSLTSSFTWICPTQLVFLRVASLCRNIIPSPSPYHHLGEIWCKQNKIIG